MASRRRRNRLHKALHGNPAVVVANIGALSNLRLAIRSKPDVALLQELWATAAEIRQAAKEHGYEAACAEGNPCLAAVLFRPGQGQQIKLPPLGEFTSRVAAACISLGGGCGCCYVSAYGISSGTAGQKEKLSQALRVTLEELRALGRGSCLMAGDFNAEQQELPVVQELLRAGWADWGSEPTCITAGTKKPRRIDQAWMSPELQARLQAVELSWAEGLKAHAWQQGTFRGGPAEQFAQWVQPDAGPEAEEQGFLDMEFWALFAPAAPAWEAARLRGDADGMWQQLEATLVRCHGLRSPGFQQPAATTRLAAEEPRRDPHTGDALSQELTATSLRKCRLQQWLGMWGRPECEKQLRQLRRAIASEAEPCWAALVAADPTKALLEQLIVQARLDEDQLRAKTRQIRRNGWRQWCLAQNQGGM